MLGLNSQTLSITATCFQCHGYGRRAGLKIRWRSDQSSREISDLSAQRGRQSLPQRAACTLVRVETVATHEWPKTTKLADPTRVRIGLDEIKRIRM